MSTITESNITAQSLLESMRDHPTMRDWARVMARAEEGVDALLRRAEGIDPSTVTDTILINAWRDAFPVYLPSEGDDEVVVEWMREKLALDDTPEEPKPETPTPDGESALMMFAPHERDQYVLADWEAAADVIGYQMSGWRRGVRVPSSPDAAVQQFWRRLERAHGKGSLSTNVRRLANHTVNQMFKDIIRGEATKPMSPSESDVQRFLERFLVEAMPDGVVDYYPVQVYLFRVITRVLEGRASVEWEDVSDEGDFAEKFRDMIATQWSTAYASDIWDRNPAIRDSAWAGWCQFTKRSMVATIFQPEEFEDLNAWLLSKHKDDEPVQNEGTIERFSLENGVLDFLDSVKAGDIKEGESYIDTLRRQVRSYGWTKFTGKLGRTVLEESLRRWAEPLNGIGLTPEEWAARWERRDLAVSYVAGRYGVQQNMCKVLEAATAELGIPPMREPKRVVTFKNGGIEVRVEVESWSNDHYALRTKAREKWERMSEEDRKSAIVRYEATLIPWDSLDPQV